MVSRDDQRLVLWPRYFDRSSSRLHGRRLPLKNAVDTPTAEAIAKAAKSLGLNPVLEKTSSYPKLPWKQEGRVLVDKKKSKTELIRLIASRL